MMMYSSEAISGSNTMLVSSTNNSYKHGFDEDFFKGKDSLMMSSSDPFQHQKQQNTTTNGGGLTRYRSAPSTFFAGLLDTNNGATSDSSHEDEADTMFSAAAFMDHHHQFSANLKQERLEYDQQQNGFSGGETQMVYEASINCGHGDGSYGIGNGSNSLIRQSCSPAGFFNGFDVLGEGGSFRCNDVARGDSVSNGLNNNMNLAYRTSSASSRFMPSIAENGHEIIEAGSLENEQMGEGRCYVPGLANGSWSDSSSNHLKRNRDGDIKMFSTSNGLENQDKDSRDFTTDLSHHLSLPKTSAEMAAVEKYLHFQQDVVPWKTRAKRGCATHPRSIAERMRRTRISERMKKLQELFPTMDKQTNTADMLYLAVEYIKDLQKQVKTLTDVKAKCTCPSK